jgi:hypothetical protein
MRVDIKTIVSLMSGVLSQNVLAKLHALNANDPLWIEISLLLMPRHKWLSKMRYFGTFCVGTFVGVLPFFLE